MLHHAPNKEVRSQQPVMPDERNERQGRRQEGRKPDNAHQAQQDKAREPTIVPRPFDACQDPPMKVKTATASVAGYPVRGLAFMSCFSSCIQPAPAIRGTRPTNDWVRT